MPKFKIGQILKLNDFYKKEYKRIFNKKPMDYSGKVLDIYEQEGYEPIYKFGDYDKRFDCKMSFAERFLEAV